VTSTPISDRATRHVSAFNDCVRSGRWADFAERFASDATMCFAGVPLGPYIGRDAIAAAYASQPPSDTLTVTCGNSSGDVDRLRFTWDSSNTTGTMVMRWSNDLIAELTVTFD
jgi:steroid Delta-isomerase